MVVKHSYKPHWPDELELNQGDVIQVLFKHEESRWYGRLQTGQQGYFPATHVTELIEVSDYAGWKKQLQLKAAIQWEKV